MHALEKAEIFDFLADKLTWLGTPYSLLPFIPSHLPTPLYLWYHGKSDPGCPMPLNRLPIRGFGFVFMTCVVKVFSGFEE